jgi:DNA helicase IV
MGDAHRTRSRIAEAFKLASADADAPFSARSQFSLRASDLVGRAITIRSGHRRGTLGLFGCLLVARGCAIGLMVHQCAIRHYTSPKFILAALSLLSSFAVRQGAVAETTMTRTWSSGTWGERFTRSTSWSLTLDAHAFTLTVDSRSLTRSVLDSDFMVIKEGFLWSSVVFELPGRTRLALGGIPNRHAREMTRVLAAARADYEKHLSVRERIRTFDSSIAPISSWCNAMLAAAKAELIQRGWLSARFCAHWLQSKPNSELDALLNEPDISAHLVTRSAATQSAVRLWRRELSDFAACVNERHVEAELVACKDFFNQVEKAPLTEEQARAVVCFDDRVQVIASAGSGKTSTMVAKAGYALHRTLVPASKILLVAFNKDAADELQSRVRERLGPMGFPAEEIVARTFHKFGLDIIGHATGRRPSLAPWLDSGRDIEHLSFLVDGLKDRDPQFRAQWDLFRIVFGRDLPALAMEESEPEDWDRDTRLAGFLTLRNEVVKSHGERVLANWLFYNGVDYRYERPYEVDTADPQHRQYLPDFYYPGAKAYHEHWALDQNGRPPDSFHGYLSGMEWKREQHARNGTVLLETTTAQLWSGVAFSYLERELTARGIVLDPNPDRLAIGSKPVEHRQLVSLFRVFLTHAKSNCLTNVDLRERLSGEAPDRFHFRHRMFLGLFERVRSEWERSLAESGAIDFEDMLNIASDHLEAGDWTSPYELVMVDEFQDASRARARLVRALVAPLGKRLFAVGDDWQSINRFAGADISVMTGFEKWFGKAQILRLERTFRCPQSLCNVAGRFVQENPQQLRKSVASDAPEYSPTVRILEVPDDDCIVNAIRAHLVELHVSLCAGAVLSSKSGKVSVFVLGRYRRDVAYVPRCEDLSDRLDVRFSTIHSAKGLEADYVVLPRIVSGRRAFPSKRQDDPVLQLAMPEGDDHPHAEERRLFYVALTRARRAVMLVSVEHRASPFVVELVRDHNLQPVNIDSMQSTFHICPKCKKGTMVPRRGPHGQFYGCSRFPACPEISRQQ